MPPRSRTRKPAPTLTPSQRRDELRLLLRSGWQPLSAIMSRLGVSRRTAFRRLRELGETDPLESQEIDEGRLVWRLPPSTKDHTFHISTSEMIALAFVRSAFAFLAGTGIKEDLDALCDRFSHVLKTSDYAHWQNLDKKLFDMGENAYDYSDKLDVVNDVVTALLREERITLTMKDGSTAKVDPYTMVLYKKGLYVVGHSHKRAAFRKFGLDKVVDAERHAGESFPYPSDFDPASLRGPFGMIGGKKEHVVIRFDAAVAHFVLRRCAHATQSFKEVEGGIELTADPEGIEEMLSWVLAFGAKSEVLEPASLREKVAEEARRMVERYAAGSAG